jgi:hypothetical protein
MTRDELNIAWKMFVARCTLAQAEAVLCDAQVAPPGMPAPQAWIEHTSGSHCPVNRAAMIYHRGAYGERGPTKAEDIMAWSRVTHYRYAV